MFDESRLNEVVHQYKKDFAPKHWADEQYKWIAVKWFKDNFKIDAENFPEMLERSLSKTDNLLDGKNYFPAGMIVIFAKNAPEEVREMFRSLYHGSTEVFERIETFKHHSENLLERYGKPGDHHYQDEKAISTYLWLNFPDKYYIYKFKDVKKAAEVLESNYQFKKGAFKQNVTNAYQLYDEINAALKKDSELVNLLKSNLTPDCYSDPELKTLTSDLSFYICHDYSEQKEQKSSNKAKWWPDENDYSPGFDVKQWENLINNRNVFSVSSLEIMKRMLDYGGQATCNQLSVKYGESPSFYNAGSTALAKRIKDETDCSLVTNADGDEKWWPILYTGKKNDTTDGVFIWKLRQELKEALSHTDLSDVNLYADKKPAIWKISHGDLSDQQRTMLESKHAVAVAGYTNGIGRSKISQGENFINGIHKGDYFYLCYGSSVRLLGRFTEDKAIPDDEISEGWYERSYEKIVDSKDLSPYSGEVKWWTPNGNSTCIKVEKDELTVFESFILKPYFDMNLSDLLEKNEAGRNYWWLNANPKIWSFSNIQVGEQQAYTLYNDNGHKRRIFQNFLDAKAGDLVIGYESNPVKQIVALAEIYTANDGQKIVIKKTEVLPNPIDYRALKDCQELQKMEFFLNPNGSLFKLTKGEFDFIMDIIRDENPISTGEKIKPYTKADFLNDVYMSEDKYNLLTAVLKDKKNIILQGAPGVGKTFCAKRLAYSMMNEMDDDKIEFVQFHQNYSYEDFMMGYKPSENGFELKYGVFYRFCQKAANEPNKQFFFIIDEINRGNLSKIFGELLMLIEKDYRDQKITLAYNGMRFAVPGNLYIIGMMNTADRNLAMIDYALRRRFSFFEIDPAFESAGFSKYKNSLQNDRFNSLIDRIIQLNHEIKNDRSLGKGFCIGHSYFCGKTKDTCTVDWMKSVINFDILPMLSEYWFDDDNKVQKWEKILNGVFDDQG